MDSYSTQQAAVAIALIIQGIVVALGCGRGVVKAKRRKSKAKARSQNRCRANSQNRGIALPSKPPAERIPS